MLVAGTFPGFYFFLSVDNQAEFLLSLIPRPQVQIRCSGTLPPAGDALTNGIFGIVGAKRTLTVAGELFLPRRTERKVRTPLDLVAQCLHRGEKGIEVGGPFLKHIIDGPSQFLPIRQWLALAQPCSVVSAAGFWIFRDGQSVLNTDIIADAPLGKCRADEVAKFLCTIQSR